MSGNRGKGRPRGSRNKSTAAVKELLLNVNHGLGGEKAMLSWAMSNQTEFYKLLARLIPQEHTGEDGGPIRTVSRIESVIVDPKSPGR